MAKTCAQCGKQAPRGWKQGLKGKLLCPECYDEGYRLVEFRRISGKTTIEVRKE